jgi:hypothetical protein
VLLQLNEWCKHNKLYINWAKTFNMFIHDKRIVVPDFFEINDTRINTTKTFKLLGVNIDDKLQFIDYAAQLSLSINRKMHTIKKLFYLPYSIKILFFKLAVITFNCLKNCSLIGIGNAVKSIAKYRSIYNLERIYLVLVLNVIQI